MRYVLEKILAGICRFSAMVVLITAFAAENTTVSPRPPDAMQDELCAFIVNPVCNCVIRENDGA